MQDQPLIGEKYAGYEIIAAIPASPVRKNCYLVTAREIDGDEFVVWLALRSDTGRMCYNNGRYFKPSGPSTAHVEAAGDHALADMAERADVFLGRPGQ